MTTQVLVACLTIFFGRILDVPLGSIRTIFIVKGRPVFAALCAFVEGFIWFMVVRTALTALSGDLFIALFYSAGFAVGTLTGTFLSKRFIVNNIEVQIVTGLQGPMIQAIRKAGHGVSAVNMTGTMNTDKHMLFVETDTKKFAALKALINEIDPGAFVVVKETQFVQNGFFKRK